MPDRMFVGSAQFVFLLRERRDPFTGGQVLDAISIYVPRREDDIRGAISTPPNWLFQFTSPQGGRPGCSAARYSCLLYFNPRPHKGDDEFIFAAPYIQDDFNPRPHKGDDAVSFTT